MSLTSLLLKSKTVDSELDELFKSAVKPVTLDVPAPVTEHENKNEKRNKKRKVEELVNLVKGGEASVNDDGAAGPEKKRVRKSGGAVEEESGEGEKKKKVKEDKKAKAEKKVKEPEVKGAEPTDKTKEKKTKTHKKEKKESPVKIRASSSSKKFKIAESSGEDADDSEDDSDIENQYLAERQKKDAKKVAAAAAAAVVEGENETDEGKDVMSVDEDEDKEADEEDEDEDDSDETPQTFIHESLQEKRPKSGPKQRFIPEDETPERRDQRTVFVGNLPLAVAQKRPLQKQLRKHILSFVPTAKIESIRFRSIPFQKPTSKLPTSEDEGNGSTSTKKPTHPPAATPTQPPRHGSARATSWRTKLDGESIEDATLALQDAKKYLTPQQKKKIAFIQQEFHATADSVNAYIVFAHPVPSGLEGRRASNVPPAREVMNPYEAAGEVVGGCNGSVFLGRVVRVDRVGKVGVKGKVGGEGEGEGAVPGALLDADPKFTIFVGNLDFASKEEDLRVFFENLVKSEKGEPPVVEDDEDSDEDVEEEEEREGQNVEAKIPRTWVARVRIIRDKETQLGKGFAYVQFSDKECVDEILALEDTKLKFAKRKLRVQRCKTLPGSSIKVKPTASKSSSKDKSSRNNNSRRGGPAVIVPKGDPTLGDRLAHLSKPVRKAAKAADGDRIARRLAKKKARMAMGPPGGLKSAGDVPLARDSRTRKKSTTGGHTGKKTGKPRVRNEKNAAGRNAKK